MSIKYPKIYLVLDNCFALKRWVEPAEWMKITKEIGFDYVEASFDNEIDFLYAPDSYIEEWFYTLKECEDQYGVKVVNFHTGYQTYRTIGLAHSNQAYVDGLENIWFKKAIDKLSKRGNGLGFAFHAVPDNKMKSKAAYRESEDQVRDSLNRLCDYADQVGGTCKLSIEAMYAPHQPPWTIATTKEYLNYNPDLYITVDVGHMIGQKKFQFPSLDEVEQAVNERKKLEKPSFVLFSQKACETWEQLKAKDTVAKEEIDTFYKLILEDDYLYSKDARDADPYAWLEELGCYSPIIHLQQTNGISASHAAFTTETNRTGIIEPKKVLQAIKASYEKAHENLLYEEEKKVEAIYLSFEIFSSNTDTTQEIKDRLKETFDYWRQAVPADGLSLDELV
ncbi:TIM barrel protein [Candidatus Enterococcus moelleringii]|nr:TIM barrel protein [Enterococcus sp. 669A]